MNHHLLLERAKQGDFEARDELVMENYPLVGPRLTDDEAQEALLIALRNLHKFREESSVGTWMNGIRRMIVRGRKRQEQRRVTGLGGDADPFADVPGKLPAPPDIVIRKELARRIAVEIERLPREQAEAVRLWMSGLRHREIAGRLGVTLGRASSRLYRALEILSTRLPDER